MSQVDRLRWVPGSARNARLTAGVHPNQHRGIEIGALNNPIIRPEFGMCEYVDYTDLAGLREQHKGLPDRAAGIVPVNHVWSGSGSLAAIVGGPDPYDFAIASHVIEHVPNTLGWFRGIHEVLKPGGVFNLAIPDKRYTFDVNCPVSTIGQLIEADLLNYTRPSIRQMFDHCVRIARIEPGHIWAEQTNIRGLAPYNGDFAVWLAESQAIKIVEDGAYFDSHCWIYTPLSFLDLIRHAVQLGRFDFEILNFETTKPDEFEFFVSLMKPRVETDRESLKWRQIAAIDEKRRQVEHYQYRAELAASRG